MKQCFAPGKRRFEKAKINFSVLKIMRYRTVLSCYACLGVTA